MLTKKLLWISVACMLTMLSGCGKSSEESSVPETSPVTETIAEQSPESEAENSSPESEDSVLNTETPITQQDVVQAMQEVIQEQNYTADFTYSDTEQTYFFIYWEDQFGATIDMLPGNPSGWDGVLTEFQNIYAQFSDILLNYDQETAFILKIVDERDHNRDLIVVQDNEITYDIMQEKAAEQNPES